MNIHQAGDARRALETRIGYLESELAVARVNLARMERVVQVAFIGRDYLSSESWDYLDGFGAAGGLWVGDRVKAPTKWGNRQGIVVRTGAGRQQDDWSGPLDTIRTRY